MNERDFEKGDGMAFLDDGQRKLLGGIALGLGASWFAREFLTPFAQLARPAAKAGLKSGILVWDRSREAAGRAVETVDDLMAEVRAEQAIDDLTAAPIELEQE